MNIGFSTGCFYRTNLGLKEKLDIGLKHGCTAVEVSFPFANTMRNFVLDSETERLFGGYNTIYAHAPWYSGMYNDSGQTHFILTSLLDLRSRVGLKGIVVHPDVVGDWKILHNYQLPFLIENMDPRKSGGVEPNAIREFEERTDFDFVLDLQHVYEGGPFMDRVNSFCEVMGNRLEHLHVSGGNGCADRHTPMSRSSNGREIARVLSRFEGIPLILEGTFGPEERLDTAVKRELSFVRRVLEGKD